MSKKKILSVVGARPHFMKASAVTIALRAFEELEEIMVHSGQHYDKTMSEVFFEELDLPRPKYNLEIGSVGHNVFLAEFLAKFDPVLEKENPDFVVVYGDTNTTSAAAIAAAKRNIPVGHVEAGLREFDKSIPEEINKLLTDSVSDLLFSPTQTGVDNLRAEGKTRNVFLTGDTNFDILSRDHKYLNISELRNELGIDKEYIFMTCHRAANTNYDNLKSILSALSQITTPVVWPIHPRTSKVIDELELRELIPAHVILTEPLPYWKTQTLLKNAKATLTDSGGIIKEAYFHKVPSIIIDKQTEWIEAVEEGWATVVGPNQERIVAAIENIKIPQIHTQALGQGKAGKIIVEAIVNYLNAEG